MLARAAVLTLVTLTACGRVGETAAVARERPPTPLDSIGVASDAQLDSSGAILGSFVGEGTNRAVHLLSSDTGFIRTLLQRWHPDLARSTDPWGELARKKRVTLGHPAAPAQAIVGSPLGHTAVGLGALVVRGGTCHGRGAQAELVVEDRKTPGNPPLLGPVLGSFNTGPAAVSSDGNGSRMPLPSPSPGLIRRLLAGTARATDSLLAPDYGPGGVRADSLTPVEVNTLADVDAADVIPFHSSDSTTQYAVSLRSRRLTATGDTLVAASVMTWDSAGGRRQVIFRPTLLSLRGGRLSRPGTPTGAFIGGGCSRSAISPFSGTTSGWNKWPCGTGRCSGGSCSPTATWSSPPRRWTDHVGEDLHQNR